MLHLRSKCETLIALCLQNWPSTVSGTQPKKLLPCSRQCRHAGYYAKQQCDHASSAAVQAHQSSLRSSDRVAPLAAWYAVATADTARNAAPNARP